MLSYTFEYNQINPSHMIATEYQSPGLKEGYYRRHPSLYDSVATSKHLVDLDGTQVLFYRLYGYVFYTMLNVLSKTDQFCAKLRVVSSKQVVVFGMNKFTVIDSYQQQIAAIVYVYNIIYCIYSKNGYVVVMTSDEDGYSKLVYCWKIRDNGEIETKFDPVEINLPDYNECTYDNIELSLILSLNLQPKIYVFWKGTNQLIEIDPSKRQVERYSRVKQLSFVTDLDKYTYAYIIQNKIMINSKYGGKYLAIFTNYNEIFLKLFYRQSSKKEFFSISNKGMKRWLLESDSYPEFYIDSDVNPIENVYFSGYVVIGINTDRKYVISWSTPTEYIISNFPNEAIRKILRLNEHRVCLLLEATVSKELEHYKEHQIYKYNKMEIYDFPRDTDVAKKAVLKFNFRIDMYSAIASYDVVRFILNEECKNYVNKYIFRWSPFCAEKKKEVKKREIVGAKEFDAIKLYVFDRILIFKRAKEAQTYDIFQKESTARSLVSLYDFGAKKLGEYELSADIKHVYMSEMNQLYTIGQDKFSVYSIDPSHKNRLYKVHELYVSVLSIQPIYQYLLIQKYHSFLLYDRYFELVMKEEAEEYLGALRILHINNKRFIIANQKEMRLWDLEKEQTTKLPVEGCDANLIELMANKYLVLADKWIRVIDFTTLQT